MKKSHPFLFYRLEVFFALCDNIKAKFLQMLQAKFKHLFMWEVANKGINIRPYIINFREQGVRPIIWSVFNKANMFFCKFMQPKGTSFITRGSSTVVVGKVISKSWSKRGLATDECDIFVWLSCLLDCLFFLFFQSDISLNVSCGRHIYFWLIR